MIENFDCLLYGSQREISVFKTYASALLSCQTGVRTAVKAFLIEREKIFIVDAVYHIFLK